MCQGSKRGYFGDRVYLYDEQHYLAVSVPVPFTMETEATPECPLLAIYMHLDFQVATGLALQLERYPATGRQEMAQSMMSSPIDNALRASVVRFLEALNQPLEAEILGPTLVREIYFRVLTGAQGKALRAALAMRGKFGKIGKVLRYIHDHFAQTLCLSQLAGEEE